MVHKENLQEFISSVRYPLVYLDFETVIPAVPIFNKTRPYQQIPFQFSAHIEEQSGEELQHFEYLHKQKSDPRRSFAVKLIEICETAESIMVYNANFEVSRVKELALVYPDLSERLLALNDNMVDLLVPFRNRWLYSPAQKGSASIKSVLPAFTELSYADLEINNGGLAMEEYGRFLDGAIPLDKLPALWQQLSEYCKLDTFAMVELFRVIKKYAEID